MINSVLLFFWYGKTTSKWEEIATIDSAAQFGSPRKIALIVVVE